MTAVNVYFVNAIRVDNGVRPSPRRSGNIGAGCHVMSKVDNQTKGAQASVSEVITLPLLDMVKREMSVSTNKAWLARWW